MRNFGTWEDGTLWRGVPKMWAALPDCMMPARLSPPPYSAFVLRTLSASSPFSQKGVSGGSFLLREPTLQRLTQERRAQSVSLDPTLCRSLGRLWGAFGASVPARGAEESLLVAQHFWGVSSTESPPHTSLDRSPDNLAEAATGNFPDEGFVPLPVPAPAGGLWDHQLLEEREECADAQTICATSLQRQAHVAVRTSGCCHALG